MVQVTVGLIDDHEPGPTRPVVHSRRNPIRWWHTVKNRLDRRSCSAGVRLATHGSEAAVFGGGMTHLPAKRIAACECVAQSSQGVATDAALASARSGCVSCLPPSMDRYSAARAPSAGHGGPSRSKVRMSRPCWCPLGNSSRTSHRQAATIARTSRRHSSSRT